MDCKPSLDELITHVDVVEWLRLGVLLKLDMKDLQAIERERSSIADRLQQMYNLWLTSQPGATRRQLLKALEVMKALTLADNYKKWIASNAVKPPNTRSASASKISSKQTPRSLDITDLNEILRLLRSGLFNGRWEDLGLQLGLYKPTLSNIQANYPRDNDACLRECIAKWLQRADAVDSKGGANYVTLAEALEEMEQKNPADHIRSEKLGLQENTHSSGLRERQPQPEPVPTPSVSSSYIAEEEDGDYQPHAAARQRKGKVETIQESLQQQPPPGHGNDESTEETDFEAPAAKKRPSSFRFALFCLILLIMALFGLYFLDCSSISKSDSIFSELCRWSKDNLIPIGIFGLIFIIVVVIVLDNEDFAGNLFNKALNTYKSIRKQK